MKPVHKKERIKKEVRKIHKRRRVIWQKRKALGYRELEKPIRHGWFKEIVIKANVERYKNQSAILEIYDIVQKCYWGRTKAAAEKKWIDQVSKLFIYKDFPTITKKQFNRLSYKAQHMCTSFYYTNECKKKKLRFYVRIPKGSYKIKYTRAYITHSKIIDPLLESEDALFEQQLLKRKYYEACQSSYKWKYYWETSRKKQEKRKVNYALKVLQRFTTEEIIKENTSWEIN